MAAGRLLRVVLVTLISLAPAVQTAAAPSADAARAPATRARVLVLDFRNDGAQAEVVRALRDTITTHLHRRGGIVVLSSEDMRRVMALEAEKASMGCDDESCLAEIASALGADFVVFGNVVRLDELIAVNMNLLDMKQGASIGREEVEARSLSELPPLIRSASDRLVEKVPGIAPREVVAATITPPGPLASPLLWTGVAAAALGGALGVAGGLTAIASASTVQDTVSSKADKDGAETGYAVGLGMAAGGAVVVVVGAVVGLIPLLLE